MFGWEFGKGDGGISGVRGFCVGCIVCKNHSSCGLLFCLFLEEFGIKGV